MGIEHHGQGFSATLGMPENAAFAIVLGGYFCFFHSLANGKILVIASQNFDWLLAVAGEKNEVFQNVQESLLLEDTLVEGIELGIGGVFSVAIFGFPLHKAVQTRGYGTGLVGGQIADDTDRVVNEHGGDILHVIPDLVICVLDAGLLLGGALQLHQHQRQTVDKQDNIGTAVIAVFNVCILVDRIESVVVRFVIVNQVYNRGTLLTPVKILHRDSVLQIIHEDHVFLHQAAGIEVLQLGNSLIDGFRR